MELQILKAEKLCDNWDDCKRKGNRLYVRNINGNYIHLCTTIPGSVKTSPNMDIV